MSDARFSLLLFGGAVLVAVALPLGFGLVIGFVARNAARTRPTPTPAPTPTQCSCQQTTDVAFVDVRRTCDVNTSLIEFDNLIVFDNRTDMCAPIQALGGMVAFQFVTDQTDIFVDATYAPTVGPSFTPSLSSDAPLLSLLWGPSTPVDVDPQDTFIEGDLNVTVDTFALPEPATFTVAVVYGSGGTSETCEPCVTLVEFPDGVPNCAFVNETVNVLFNSSEANLIKADGAAPEDNPYDPAEGWYYLNEPPALNKINWYFVGGANLRLLGGITYVYARLTLYKNPSLGDMPFISIYTKPMTGQQSRIGSWFTSRLTYIFTQAQHDVILPNQTIVMAVNSDPVDRETDVQHFVLTYDPLTSIGPQNATEEILAIALSTNSASNAGNVEIGVERFSSLYTDIESTIN